MKARQHVRIGVERDSDVAVAQALRDDFRMGPRGEQERRVGMPQPMQRRVWKAAAFDDSSELMGSPVGIDRRAIEIREHVAAAHPRLSSC